MSVLTEHVVVLLVALVCVAATALGYLSRYEIERPPVGVYTFPDIVFMATAVVVVPLLYLHVPIAIEACVFGIVLLTILYYTLQPALPRRAALACAVALLATDAALGVLATPGASRTAYLVVNDAVLALALLGVANLYAQSGMRAAHVALLAGILAAYDYLATAVLPTTADLVAKLGQQPFAPQIVVGAGRAQVGVGLGDTLMLALWTVVVSKAFGRLAGLVAAAVGIGSIAALLSAFLAGSLSGQVPAMTLMGPLIVVQYVVWRRRAVRERTTGEWRTGVLPQPAEPAIDPALAVEVGLLLDRLAGSTS
jgi:hypothetical protein